MKELNNLRAIKDLYHRDEKYKDRLKSLCTTVVFDSDDLTVPIPRRLNMRERFNPDNEDHWIVRNDLASLWYDRACHDDNATWHVIVTHRPYEKRRARTICFLSNSVRPSHNVDRWRDRVDEDCSFTALYY